jgi:hypothetical protein
MKVKFNFNISVKPKRQTRSPSALSYSVIETKVEGIVKILEDLTFRVEYKGKLYKITQESYNTKGRKILYARKLDKYGHRIKIIRDADNRDYVDSRHYVPFAAGLIAKGRIVKLPFSSELFHIVSCYNAGDAESVVKAFKEWKEYEQNNVVDGE